MGHSVAHRFVPGRHGLPVPVDMRWIYKQKRNVRCPEIPETNQIIEIPGITRVESWAVPSHAHSVVALKTATRNEGNARVIENATGKLGRRINRDFGRFRGVPKKISVVNRNLS